MDIIYIYNLYIYLYIYGCFQPTAGMCWNPRHFALCLKGTAPGRAMTVVTVPCWRRFLALGHEMVPGSISRAAPSSLLSHDMLQQMNRYMHLSENGV